MIKPKKSRQRLYASLIVVGAGILLFRSIMMLAQGALATLTPWVAGLLVAEFLLDMAIIPLSIRWLAIGEERCDRLPLRVAAAATILHAFRVLIFVLGRTGPWFDFDVRPAQRALHSGRWSWGGVYFAAIMSVLGVLGVVIIWIYRRRRKRG